MSEPYDVTSPDDRTRGLRRLVDRTGREWTEPDVSETYTPGPWLFDEEWNRKSEGPLHRPMISARPDPNRGPVFIASVHTLLDGSGGIANARLIRSAPEMLAMLARILRTCRLSEDHSLQGDIERLIARATEPRP